MLEIYFYTILSVVVISSVSLIGAFLLFLKSEKLVKLNIFLVALSAGALLGDAFLHLLPETIEKNPESMVPWFSVLAGMILFFVLEKVVCWRHCHVPTSESHPHPLGIMNLVGDGLHNFIDGMLIAGTFLVSIPLGLATSLAVITHEIPQEISELGVLLHSGYSKKSALLWNLLSGLMSVLGAILVLVIGKNFINITDYLLPFTAGGFIYVATADLIPELHKETIPHKSILQIFSILIGFGLLFMMKIWL